MNEIFLTENLDKEEKRFELFGNVLMQPFSHFCVAWGANSIHSMLFVASGHTRWTRDDSWLGSGGWAYSWHDSDREATLCSGVMLEAVLNWTLSFFPCQLDSFTVDNFNGWVSMQMYPPSKSWLRSDLISPFSDSCHSPTGSAQSCHLLLTRQLMASLSVCHSSARVIW